jgi:hypothetical protein
MSDVCFDLAGRATLAVTGDKGLAAHARAEMNPFPALAGAGPGGGADVVLAAEPEVAARPHLDVQNPAGDGLVTASDGRGLAIVFGGRRCFLPEPESPEGGPARIALEPGFPVARIFGWVVRPALQMGMPRRGAVAMHAAAVALDGGAVVVAGWSESGKTETALALIERGAHFVSDKWTVLGEDGEVSAFPIGVGIRRWVLPHLPRLQAALPRAARGQFRVARAAAAALRPVTGRSPSGRLAGLAVTGTQRGLALADRAALTPTQLREAYGQADDPTRRLPVRAVVLLTNVPMGAPTARPADPAWAAERLARSAAFERRPYAALHERAAYALARGGGFAAAAVESERELLAAALARTTVIEVRTPFPTDPGPVAAAAAGAL